MAFCTNQGRPHKKDGPYSWLICVVVFFIHVILFGSLLSFGVLLPVMSDYFNKSKGATAWIGSLAIGFTFLCGPIVIKIIARFGERPVGVFSGVTASLAIAISSFVPQFWMLYLSYGICFGFFSSCLINTLILITRRYFQHKLAMAMGIAISGASLGVLAVGPALQALLDSLGWRNSLRVMSGAVFLTGLLCIFFDPNVELEGDREPNNNKKYYKEPESHVKMCCSILKTPKYAVGTITIFLAFFGLYVPMFHLVTFAKDRQITASKSSILFIYIGALSTISRIVTGKVIDRKWLTPLQGVQLSCFFLGVLFIILNEAKVFTHFIIFGIFYGFAGGAFIISQAVFYITCFPDLKMASVGWTTGYVFSGVALFMGAPFAGFIADYFGSYIPTFYTFGGVMIFAGALPFCLCCGSKSKATRTEFEETAEVQSKLIGYRLANFESSLNITFV